MAFTGSQAFCAARPRRRDQADGERRSGAARCLSPRGCRCGNTFGTLTLTARSANVAEADDTELGAARLSGAMTLVSDGGVAQSAALSIAGELNVSTTAALGDVVIDNSAAAAAASTLGHSAVGGSYKLRPGRPALPEVFDLDRPTLAWADFLWRGAIPCRFVSPVTTWL